MFISLFVLMHIEVPGDVVGVFAPLFFGQIAMAVAIICLDGLIFGREPHPGTFVRWAFGAHALVVVVIVALGVWQATWPYQLAALVPLAVMVFLLRSTRHLRPGSAAFEADLARVRGEGRIDD